MTEKMTGNTGKKTENRPAGVREAGTRTTELPQEVRRYADIIGLEHPVSRKHRQMSMTDRAAQFSPFAALTGYGDMIEDTAGAYEDRVAHEILLEAAEDI